MEKYNNVQVYIRNTYNIFLIKEYNLNQNNFEGDINYIFLRGFDCTNFELFLLHGGLNVCIHITSLFGPDLP